MTGNVWGNLPAPPGASGAGQDKPVLQRPPLLLWKRVLPRRGLALPDRTETCESRRQKDQMNPNITSQITKSFIHPRLCTAKAIQIWF